MSKIFEQAKDLHVKAVVVFGKTADHKLYANADYDAYLDANEVADAFTKGLLVIAVGDDTFVPVAFEDSKYVTVGITSNAVAGAQWTVAVEG